VAREDHIVEATHRDFFFSSVDKRKVEFRQKHCSCQKSGFFFLFCDISA